MDIAKTMEPPLTSVAQSSFLVSYRAVKAALELCRGKKPESEEMKAYFHRRESCGCGRVHAGRTTVMSPEMPHVFLAERIELMLEELFSSIPYEKEKSGYRKLMQGYFQDVVQMVFEKKAEEISCDALARYLDEMCRNPFVSRRLLLEQLGQLLRDVAETVIHKKEEEFCLPDEMYLTAYYNEQEMVSFRAKEMIPVRTGEGLAQLLPPDRAHFYTAFVLFSGEEQYGMLLCEAEQRDFPFSLMCSMQLGSLRRSILDFVSSYDEMSQLLNRRGFMERAIRLLEEQQGKHAYFLFGDVDHLKEINDCFGHAAGDFAIRTAAEYLRYCTPADAVTARIG